MCLFKMLEINLNSFLKEKKKESLTRDILVCLQQKANCSFLCPAECSVAASIKPHRTGLASDIPVMRPWKDYIQLQVHIV